MEEQVKQLKQKQQKLKKARLITIIAALLLIALCVCIMFDVISFEKTEEEPQTEEVSSTEEETPAPDLPAENTPAPKKPSVEDLNGCSNRLYHPKPENYLDEYETAIARSNKKDTVALTYETKPWQHHDEIVVELENNTTVTVLARENSYSLVLVKEGLAGWLPTYELEKKQG